METSLLTTGITVVVLVFTCVVVVKCFKYFVDNFNKH
nr:hypothetical protein UMIGIWAJ_UMIGIWAJ_CDS_0007 [Microvirus sp.]